jgi:hypothetical protein
MLRQPVKTTLLALLLIVASFSFVMRSVEHLVINEQINEISKFYRAVGFLSYDRDNHFVTDVRQGAEIVAASPHVRFSDERRLAEAILLDMPNTGSNNGTSGGMISRAFDSQEDAFFTEH